MATVSVKLTNKVVGTSLIVPFNHSQGLQLYPAGQAKAGQPVIYQINKYEMVVNGSTKYEVVRFGLQNNGTISPSRVSDAGLTAPRTVHPSWVPGYSPHSFTGGPFAGAWRILPGQGFLIHEGANEALGQVGGSLGCVEVLGGKWPDFLNELKTVCGVDWPTIGARGLIELTVEAGSYPTATLV
jgi:hypothetical protein